MNFLQAFHHFRALSHHPNSPKGKTFKYFCCCYVIALLYQYLYCCLSDLYLKIIAYSHQLSTSLTACCFSFMQNLEPCELHTTTVLLQSVATKYTQKFQSCHKQPYHRISSDCDPKFRRRKT